MIFISFFKINCHLILFVTGEVPIGAGRVLGGKPNPTWPPSRCHLRNKQKCNRIKPNKKLITCGGVCLFRDNGTLAVPAQFVVGPMWFERRPVRVSAGDSQWMPVQRPPADRVSAPPVVPDSANFPPVRATTSTRLCWSSPQTLSKYFLK